MRKDIVAKLNAEVMKILGVPDVQKRLFEIGAEPVGNTPAEMSATIKSDTEKYAVVVKKANVKIE
ncbi:MAG: tripartite tricarboxylate transporter substrate-binding protein [Burkholderiales bacterium]|jgi:tripartite-type tricarboxylate transporter receptor subunit TctC|nr:tripartite tricarboxylate transporter substrate-binding protein [Burkholderiales bacterium]